MRARATATRVERALECAERLTGRQFQFCSDYAEPGYSCGDNGIVIGNWNPKRGFRDAQRRDPVSKLVSILERANYKLGWEDEWTTCGECGKAVRTAGDCYQWTPYYRILNECELICLDCLDPEEYLESIEDDPTKACPDVWRPENHGYIKFNGSFETGFHRGQTDDPKKILARMHAQGLKCVVFRIKEQSQFYTVWEAYYKEQND